MLKQQNADKLEKYINDFYSDLSKMRLDKWNYEDACILNAAIQLYRAKGEDRFKNFVLEYLDSYIDKDGNILHYKQEDYKLDDVPHGRALIFAYEQTGDVRYQKAIAVLMQHLADQPRIPAGNFWHKKIYPNQVWLDGLYMAQPFYMAYETKYNKNAHYVDICNQFQLVLDRMYDEEKGLFYHGYDDSKAIFWADKETGCSANFWLRAMGWFMVACVDTMEEMDRKEYDSFRQIMDIYRVAAHGVLKYRDRESGLFYQVVDRADVEGNYLETSGSAMVAASVLKACRMKVLLPEKYQGVGENILECIIEQKLVETDGTLHLEDNCAVAGLGPDEGRRDGSVEYYLSEPVIEDDKKGMAALFMAYAQYLQLACAVK